MFSDNFRRGDEKEGKQSGSMLVSSLANVGWTAFQAVNKLIPGGESIKTELAEQNHF